MLWVRAQLCKLQKGRTRLAAASDKAYQLLTQGRWFSPGTPASSITKTGRHNRAEILLKVALKHQKKINQVRCCGFLFLFSILLILCEFTLIYAPVLIMCCYMCVLDLS